MLQALVLTDYGELEVVQQQSDGSSIVLWSSGSRLVKLNNTPESSSQAVAAAATGVTNVSDSEVVPTDNPETPLRLQS